MDQLGQLQREKEITVDRLVTALPGRLGPAAQHGLQVWVEDHVKRRIKLVPSSQFPAMPHHASQHSSDTPPVTFTSFNLSAHAYASPRPLVQGMGYGATYSDEWVSANWNRIWGCGVTEDYYNSYGHQYYVTTTVTSPIGRAASATSYTSSSYAYVDVRLDWPSDDSGDFGEYLTSTEHRTLCPYIGFWVTMANTQKRAYFGISTACYHFAYVDPGAPVCVYLPVDGCNCKCFSSDGRRLSPPPNSTCAANPWLVERVKWKQPEGGTVECAPNPHFGYASPVTCYDCFDIGTIPP